LPCDDKQVNQVAIVNNIYPITRRLFVIIKRDGRLDEQAGFAYVNLFLSEEGQQLVEEAGLARIR
jgi:phosphate transport system substrate-binding protein